MSKWNRFSTSDGASGELSTLLAKDAEIRGTMRTQGSLRIDGKIVGDVICIKNVTIGQTGSVEGNIQAETIILAGRVKGSLVAKQKIHLEATAELEGDLTAGKLSIQEGAKLCGHAATDSDRVPSALPAALPNAEEAPQSLVPRNRPLPVS